jgi:choline dehydrogenase-like flavoprotein
MPGLFIADSSVFPTSLGVNPQLTTMMTATVIAKGMV